MGELKPGWQQVKFDDVVRLNKETCKDPEAEGIERVIGLEHLEPGDLRIRSWGDVADGTTFTKRVRHGQTLFGKRRAYQRKIAVADFDAVCSGDIYVFESADHKRLLPELLPFICQTEAFFEYAVGTSAGSLSPRTNWKSLAAYEFALPPLEEQRRISTVLTAIDRALVAVENASRMTDLTKNSLIADLSSSSDEVTLGEACLLITDGEHATPPRECSGVFLISARNIQNNRLDLSSVDYVSQATYERLSSRVKPRWGDVLISCSGSVGRVCCAPRDLPFSMVRSVALIRANPDVLNHEFLSLFLQGANAQQQICSLTSQTAQGNLFQSSIKRIRVPLIPMKIQINCVHQHGEAIKAGQLLQSRRQSLTHLRSSILNQL